MAAFDRALSRVRQDCPELDPDRINQLARQQEHTFRNTTLTPGKTLTLFARQVAQGNIACASVRHLADKKFTDSAWCQARSRLPIELIEQVQRSMVQTARRELDQTDDAGDGAYRWRGHRVYVVDGTGDSMPDTPQLREHYGVPGECKEGLGFPTSHLLLLMDQRSGLFIDCVDNPLGTSDLSQAQSMYRHMEAGDVLLGDHGFSGWGHFALILQAGLNVVLPPNKRRIISFRRSRTHVKPQGGGSKKRNGKPRSKVIEVLDKDDQLVELFKPRDTDKPAWMSQGVWDQLPPSIVVREIRRTVKRKGFRPLVVTVVTTLLDAEAYPADDVVELRLTRWMIETNLRHLKTTLKMDQLKCKTVDGVRKERLMFLLVYNLIRLIMLRASRQQRVNVNRLSFADTLAWLRYGELTVCVELKVNPNREGRLEPRVIKRRKRHFPHMRRPRRQLKAQLRARHGDTT